LPGQPQGGDGDAATGEDQDDPRKVLLRELVAYRHCRQQAALLAELAEEQGRRFTRPVSLVDDEARPSTPVGTAPSVFDLAESYSSCLARARRRRPRLITADLLSVRQRMAQLLRSLRKVDGMLFSAMRLAAATRREVVVTFLAVLELVRRRRIIVHQSELFADFRVALPRRRKEARP